jgi:hypothetical protein
LAYSPLMFIFFTRIHHVVQNTFGIFGDLHAKPPNTKKTFGARSNKA